MTTAKACDRRAQGIAGVREELREEVGHAYSSLSQVQELVGRQHSGQAKAGLACGSSPLASVIVAPNRRAQSLSHAASCAGLGGVLRQVIWIELPSLRLIVRRLLFLALRPNILDSDL